MKKDLLISPDISIKDALKKLDQTAEKILLVVNEKKQLIGALTDGDIRRGILSGIQLDETIEKIYNANPIFISKDDYQIDKLKKILLEKKIELIPIVDSEKRIIDYLDWEKAFSESPTKRDLHLIEKINIPIVIMAGGKGSRLEPFTTVLPKPLIPIGDKTILELIMEQFSFYGMSNFFLTLNYKANMIKAYFDYKSNDFRIKYIKEKDFYGTAGSLSLLKGKIKGTFFVSNCDIIIKANLSNAFQFHKKNNSTLTIISSIQHYQIPYGIVEFKKEGKVTGITEKPEYTFPINTGVYILEDECLDLIQEETFLDMPDLIHTLIKSEKNVYTYPVNENEYIDIGQWKEYRKALSLLQI
jgi:dTDP-glucose pyrophosphorylase